MKRLLFAILIAGTTALAVSGQELFLQKATAYVDKKQPSGTKENYEKAMALEKSLTKLGQERYDLFNKRWSNPCPESTKKEELDNKIETIDNEIKKINVELQKAKSKANFPHSYSLEDEARKLATKEHPKLFDLKVQWDKLFKEKYNAQMEWIANHKKARDLSDANAQMQEREASKKYDKIAAEEEKIETEIKEEIERIKAKQNDQYPDQYKIYKKFSTHTKEGACFGISARLIEAMMIAWLNEKNPDPKSNDIKWLLKYYPMLTNWDEKSDFSKEDDAQIDTLIKDVIGLHENGTRHYVHFFGSGPIWRYSYHGKDKNVVLTRKPEWRAQIDGVKDFFNGFPPASINKMAKDMTGIIQSIKSDDTGLGIVISVNKKSEGDGHAVMLYRAPKNQWFFHDPNANLESINDIRIGDQDDNDEDVLRMVVGRLIDYGDQFSFSQLTLEH